MSDSSDSGSPLLRRHSLAVEVADNLRTRLLQGEWRERMPGEMTLARQLQVGRNTVRAALSLLQGEGYVTVSKGSRREINAQAGHPAPESRRIGVLLLSMQLYKLPPAIQFWIATLKERLLQIGWKIEIITDARVYQRSPSRALEGLVARYPQAVWILHHSTAAMQNWFQERAMKVVVAGSCHEGISLPAVDFDYRAASRHAAGRFRALGHHTLGVLKSRKNLAGDAESLAGFREGAEKARVVLAIAQDNTASAVVAALRRVRRTNPDLSGLFVLHSGHFASAMTYLLTQGVAIPSQISLICRDGESFLDHLLPEPTRYRGSFESIAKAVVRVIRALGDGMVPGKRVNLVMPSFVPGRTLGPGPVPK